MPMDALRTVVTTLGRTVLAVLVLGVGLVVILGANVLWTMVLTTLSKAWYWLWS